MKMEITKMKNNFLIWTQSEAVGWTLTGGIGEEGAAPPYKTT